MKNPEKFLPKYRAMTLDGNEVIGYYVPYNTGKGKKHKIIVVDEYEEREHLIDIETLEITFNDADRNKWSDDFETLQSLLFYLETVSYHEYSYSVAQSAPGFFNHTGAYKIEDIERVIEMCKVLQEHDISTKVFKHLQLKDIAVDVKEYSEDISLLYELRKENENRD